MHHRDRGRFAEEVHALDALVALLAEAPSSENLLADAEIRRVFALRMTNRADVALRHGRALLDRLGERGDSALRARALVAVGYCLHGQGDTDGAREAGLQARALAQGTGDRQTEVDAILLVHDTAYRREHHAEALSLISEATVIAERAGLERSLARMLPSHARLLGQIGDLPQAAVIAERARELALRITEAWPRLKALLALAQVNAYLGQYEGCLALAAEATALAEEVNELPTLFNARLALGEASTALGAYDAADRYYQAALAIEGLHERQRSFGWISLALLHLIRGRLSEAAEIGERLVAAGFPTTGVFASVLTLVARLGLGDLDGAERVEGAARRGLLASQRAEPEIAGALERAGVAVNRPDAPARALNLGARCLALSWPTWTKPGREADLERVTRAISALAARGAIIPLGPYDLIARIGSGGMGEVWRAVNRDDGREVAIKLLTASAARAEATVASLRAELRAVARLSHTGVVALYDSGLVDGPAEAMSGGRLVAGSPFLVMELCTGNLLSRCGRADWDECRDALAALLGALAHAHARGIVHLDIKPDNVLTTSTRTLKLSDFGLARAVGDAQGLMAGTPAYMAPEQIRGDWRAIGPWTDLYALGALAWTLLTGAPPHGNGPSAEVFERRLTQDPRTLVPARPIAPAVRAWLNRLLTRSPASRFTFAADALAALHALEGRSDAAEVTEPDPSETQLPLDSSATFQLDGALDEPLDVPLDLEPPPEADLSQVPVVLPADWRDEAERIGGAGTGLSTFGLREVPVVGREAERDVLWTALRARGRGAVMLSGPAGVGKTRLVQWLAHRAIETGGAVVRWLGGSGGAPAVPPGDELPDNRGELLIIDDAHEDPERLLEVQRLLDLPATHPLLVLIAARDDLLALEPEAARASQRLLARADVRALPLAPLSERALDELLRARLSLDPVLSASVAARADGNPLFAVELVRDWVDRGALVPSAYGFTLRSNDPTQLPHDLSQIWALRLSTLVAGLPSGANLALELAAILGLGFEDADWRAVAASVGLDVPRELTDRLLNARLAVREGTRWRLAQGMLRESLLEAAEASGRSKRWHLAVAERLRARGADVLVVSEHLFEAGQLGDALDALQAAADLGLRRRSVVEVLRMLSLGERAMHRGTLAPDHPGWITLWLQRAGALHRAGHLDEALKVGLRAEGLAREAGLMGPLGHALRGRAALYRQRGRLAEADQTFAEAQILAERVGDRDNLCRILMGRGQVLRAMGRLQESLDLLTQTMEVAGAPPAIDALAAGIHSALAHTLELMGRHDDAGVHLRASLDRAREAGSAGDIAAALNGLADRDRQRGDLEIAEARYREVLEIGAATNPALASIAALNLALVHIAKERWPEAREGLETALVWMSRSGRAPLQCAAHLALLAPTLALGDFAAFDRHAAEARRLIERDRFTDVDAIWSAEQAVQVGRALGDARRVKEAQNLLDLLVEYQKY